MAGGTWDWDLGTGKMSLAPELERVFGMPVGSFGGSLLHFMSTVHIDDVETMAARISSALHEHAPLEIEYRGLAADGSTVWLRLNGRVVRDERSRPIGMIGEAIDVTFLHMDDMSGLAGPCAT